MAELPRGQRLLPAGGVDSVSPLHMGIGMSTPITPSKWKKQAQSYLNDLGVQFADTAASLPVGKPAAAVKSKIEAVAGKAAQIRSKRVAGKPLYFTVERKTTEVGRVLKVKTFTYEGDYFGGNKP